MSELPATPKVRDLMRTDVLTVDRGATIGHLMRVLSRHDISGAPVVDERGSVLGVVSASDVLGLAEWPELTPNAPQGFASAREPHAPSQVDGPLTPPGERGGYFAAPDRPLWHFPLERSPLTKARLEATTVEEIMTPATFHVPPDATLPELARFLVRSNIHRALVLDGPRLAGIVTSMDVVRAVADGAYG